MEWSVGNLIDWENGCLHRVKENKYVPPEKKNLKLNCLFSFSVYSSDSIFVNYHQTLFRLLYVQHIVGMKMKLHPMHESYYTDLTTHKIRVGRCRLGFPNLD